MDDNMDVNKRKIGVENVGDGYYYYWYNCYELVVDVDGNNEDDDEIYLAMLANNKHVDNNVD